MSALPRIQRALMVAAALFALVAAAALVWPARVPTTQIVPGVIDSTAIKSATTRTVEVGADAADAVVARNIFSPSRTPPARRYNPTEPDESVEVAPPEPETAGVSEAERVPRLYGVVLGPAGATALLRLDPTVPDAQIYREGDKAGRYKVVKINEKSVILDGPTGRIELRLIIPDKATP
jgi:hypothetical protein